MSLSVGASLRKLGRGSVYRELREVVDGRLRKWSISFYGCSVRGTWKGGGALLLGTIKVMKKSSGDGHLFP